MLDKLFMRTAETMRLETLEEVFGTSKIGKRGDALYRDCLLISDDSGKHLMTIKGRPHFSNAEPTKIEVNPSKWESFKEFNDIMASFCDTSKLELTRIDHAVDIDMPVATVHSGLRLKGKQLDKQYYEHSEFKRGDLNAFYQGKYPEVLNVYDRAFHLEGKTLKRNFNSPLGEITRIELRQFGRKIKHRQFIDLAKYISEPPFGSLEFYEFNLSEMPLPTHAQELLNWMKIGGLGRTIHNLNRQGNFWRDYGKYLRKKPIDETTNTIYINKLRQYFGESHESS